MRCTASTLGDARRTAARQRAQKPAPTWRCGRRAATARRGRPVVTTARTLGRRREPTAMSRDDRPTRSSTGPVSGTHAWRSTSHVCTARSSRRDRRRCRGSPAATATLAKPTSCWSGSSARQVASVDAVGVDLHDLDAVAVGRVARRRPRPCGRRPRRCTVDVDRARSRGRSRTGTAARDPTVSYQR